MPFTSHGHFKALIPYFWDVIIVVELYFLINKTHLVNYPLGHL